MKRDDSPLSRALLLLELVQNQPGITAAQLARRLKVSERAARRYVAVLREAGVPIESVRGPYGGYRVGRGLRLPPLMFSATEALGLVMAVLDGHHPVNDPSGPVGSAVRKIIRALPERVAAPAETVRRLITTAPDRAAVRPDLETTAALVRACEARHRILLEYGDPDRTWKTRVDPWAVVVRHGRWYLLCWSHDADAVRTLRVDRVLGIEPLPETCAPPEDLDPVQTLEDHLYQGWNFRVEVIIDTAVDVARMWIPGGFGHCEPIGDQHTRLTATTNEPDWYAAQLTMLPVDYRIIDSPELAAATAKIGDRLLRAVADGPR
ncbi:MAG: WYL domain-containing protein [Microlunatus sp.]|nr:WYL domain-containing protein [Microlunatus sp.]